MLASSVRRGCCTHSTHIQPQVSWRRVVVAHAVETTVPGLPLPTIKFPNLGSGLLFARTTGLKIWPGASTIANYLVAHQQAVCDKRVVELGCGLGLCSVVAAILGAKVVATDGDADLVRLLRKNIAANVSSLPAGAASGVHPAATAVLDWGNAESTAKLVEQHGNPDVIIMSDCVYGSNPGVWERLLDTLGGLSTPSTRVIQAETKRIEGVLYHMYTDMACDRGWSLTELDATPYLPADSAAGNVRLWLMERAPAAQ